MTKTELIKFLIYSCIGIILLLIAGLTFRMCIGFGLMFGFIVGLLNRIHENTTKKEE